MIDIQVGKALIPVCVKTECRKECLDGDYDCPHDYCMNCDLDIEELGGFPDGEVCGHLCCTPVTRRDGRHVVHKLVDYPQASS